MNWFNKFKDDSSFIEHIRNNSVEVEGGHDISSFIISRSPLISDAKLKNKMMIIDDKIVNFLDHLLNDKNKHPLLYYLFDQLGDVNVSEMKRKIKDQNQKLKQLQSEYLAQHLKQRKGPKRRRRQRKRTFVDMRGEDVDKELPPSISEVIEPRSGNSTDKIVSDPQSSPISNIPSISSNNEIMIMINQLI